MRSRPLHLIILTFFSLYVLSTPVIWATYYACQDYIAENFCVNKKNPDCCGKCYVSDVTDEEPAKELPKIEVRTPELTAFVLLNLRSIQPHHPVLLPYAPFLAGIPSAGFPLLLIDPPEHLHTTA